MPYAGRYRERVNTDAKDYGGSGIGNFGTVEAETEPMHGHPYSLSLQPAAAGGRGFHLGAITGAQILALG